MQINYLYLYSNRIDVYTNALTSWTSERYRRVYNRNLKIYQDVDNKIDIQIRNSDQKPVNATGSAMVFNLISRDTQNLVLQKDCTFADASIGRMFVNLTEEELFDLEPGFYEYSIFKETRNVINDTEYSVTNRSPMYIDSQYGVKDILEIEGGATGDILPSVTVDKFDYTNPATTGDDDPVFYVSSLIDAKPLVTTAGSLHTFQIYSTDYNGTVTIQGSIDEQGASPYNWVDLLSYTPSSNIEYKNIEGKYSWFRIKHEPTDGTIDKILYR